MKITLTKRYDFRTYDDLINFMIKSGYIEPENQARLTQLLNRGFKYSSEVVSTENKRAKHYNFSFKCTNPLIAKYIINKAKELKHKEKTI